MQTDEFWGLRHPTNRQAGSFRNQWNYLNAVTAESREPDSFECIRETDPFAVFQPPPVQPQPEDRVETGTTATLKQKRRRDFFDDRCGYGFGETNAKSPPFIDRVPFTWDFGFLLCKRKAWEEALEIDTTKTERLKSLKKTTQSVFDNLLKSSKHTESKSKGSARPKEAKNVSWRDFLEASKFVAEVQTYRTSEHTSPFDFTMLTPESFSCLILEMWVSEVFETLNRANRKRKKQLIERVTKSRWRSQINVLPKTLLDGLRNEGTLTLEEILRERIQPPNQKPEDGNKERPIGFTLELYKVWLLLIETIKFEELVDSSTDLGFKPRDVSAQAVSARHWYKTACKFVDSLTLEQLESNWVPVRLPGHFSVRADWFLAVVGGSRSSRLADHALDLLSSKRANIARLQLGIGLPTRDLFRTNEGRFDNSKLRTRLVSISEEEKTLNNVTYDELRKLGSDPVADNGEFYWLWRSGISAYHRHNRIWQKWLKRMILWWLSLRQRFGSDWTSGFEIYDELCRIESEADLTAITGINLHSWSHFHEMRDILIAELEDVSVSEL